ncbi:MAG: hypothetical protein D6805_07820 [Planctomycetota bacterium]|nr:MAG: hypothetical protein D6805_07820 [Planctomycetota bacterium]
MLPQIKKNQKQTQFSHSSPKTIPLSPPPTEKPLALAHPVAIIKLSSIISKKNFFSIGKLQLYAFFQKAPSHDNPRKI